MVTEALMRAWTSLVHAVLGSLPTVQVPDWLDTDGPVATVFKFGAGMGVWMPVALLVKVLGALLTAWLVGFGIKGVRILASFLTAGGGSAA